MPPFSFFESTIGLLLTLIPLISLMITIIRGIAVSVPTGLDSNILKINKIERKGHYRTIDYILLFIYNLFFATLFSIIYLSISLFSFFENRFNADFVQNYAYLIPIVRIIGDLSATIVITFYVIYISNLFARLLNPSSRHYYFFEDASLTIEADYTYLFKKCLETLITMEYKVAEVNEDDKCLEAFQIRFLQPPFGFSINKVTVTIDYEPSSNQLATDKCTVFVKCYRFNSNKILSSHIINQFIVGFLGKPRGGDEKDKE